MVVIEGSNRVSSQRCLLGRDISRASCLLVLVLTMRYHVLLHFFCGEMYASCSSLNRIPRTDNTAVP